MNKHYFFSSLNFSSQPLSKSELILSYYVSDLDLKKQKEFVKKIDNISAEIYFGEKYNEVIRKYNNNEIYKFKNNNININEMHNYINLQAIFELTNISFDVLAPINENKRNKLIKVLKKLINFLRWFSDIEKQNLNILFFNLFSKNNQNSVQIIDLIYKTFQDTFSKDILKKSEWFVEFFLFLKIFISDKIFFRMKNPSFMIFYQNLSFKYLDIIFKFIWNIITFDENEKIRPSKKLEKNKKIWWINFQYF